MREFTLSLSKWRSVKDRLYNELSSVMSRVFIAVSAYGVTLDYSELNYEEFNLLNEVIK